MAVLVAALVLAGGGSAIAAGAMEGPAAEIPLPQAGTIVPASVPIAYVATGLNYPDALGGGPAAAMHDGPILLVRTDSIPAATAAELARLNPAKIVILGGTGVVSPTVATALAAFTAGTVERVSGIDRYETAAAISQANFPAPQIAVFTASSAEKTEIGSSCTAYSGLELTIDTPVAGTLVIHANVQTDMSHVTGTDTSIGLFIGTSASDCGADYGFDTFVWKQSAAPSERIFQTVPLSRVAEIGPGVHTFYVTGTEFFGAGTTYFYFAGMDAVFYPNP
jgi:hypothetical protein